MIIIILTNNIWASNVGYILWQVQQVQEPCSRGKHSYINRISTISSKWTDGALY